MERFSSVELTPEEQKQALNLFRMFKDSQNHELATTFKFTYFPATDDSPGVIRLNLVDGSGFNDMTREEEGHDLATVMDRLWRIWK